MSIALAASGISKVYPGDPEVRALTDVDLTVDKGERLAIVGPSGSGKSTLLNVLGLLDTCSSGTYEVFGADVSHLGVRERERIRARDLGFIFQDSHVLGHRSIEENLEIRLVASSIPRQARAELISQVLALTGLEHRRNAAGRLLSGGERQRLAVARAVVTQPRIILADEPTGNLDTANADRVLELFDAQAAIGVAVIVITHDVRLAAWADRCVRIVDGNLSAGMGLR